MTFSFGYWASSFASALELVREGVAELHQHQAFAPLYVRKREETVEAIEQGDVTSGGNSTH